MHLLVSRKWYWHVHRLPMLHPFVVGVNVVHCLVHLGSSDFEGCTEV